MKKIAQLIMILCIMGVALLAFAEDIDVVIKGRDDGKRTTQKRDYAEALMNAKLQAVERAGIEITSITKVENFRLKSDMIESKAKGVLLPGFQVMDIGYQADGTYLVILTGKVRTQLPTGGKTSEFDNSLLALKKVESLVEVGTSYNEYSSALSNMSLCIKLYTESTNTDPEAVKLMVSVRDHYLNARSYWKSFIDAKVYIPDFMGDFMGYHCKEKEGESNPWEKMEVERCKQILGMYPNIPVKDGILGEDVTLSHIWALASADIKKLKDLQKK